MPRILKRPMFSRGGSTNENNGIMTGLVDRKGYAEDTGIDSRVVAPTQSEIYADEYYDQLSKIQPPKPRFSLAEFGTNLASGKYAGDGLISSLAGSFKDPYATYSAADDERRNLDYNTKMAAAKMGISKADAEAIAKAKALATTKKGFRTLTVPEAQSVLKTTYNPQKTYQINLDNGKITPISGTGTTVNITNQKETEEEKELGRVFGKEYSEIIKQGNLANINDQKLEILASVNESEDLKLGKLSEFRTEVQKLAETFGFDPELQDTTTAEIVTGISGGLVLDGLQKFVGAISDGERAFVKDITPGLSMSREGNQYLIQIAKRQNELARGYSEFASEWISRNKGLSKNDIETGMSWGKAKVQWHKNNPLINPELKDQLNTLSKQVGSEFTTNIIPREGKNYIYHYGVGFTIDAEGNKIKNDGYYTELK